MKLRSFREGDEETIVRIFNEYMSRFVGPLVLSPKEWRSHHRREGWNNPSVDKDKDCVRLAAAGGHIVGYATTNYRPDFQDQYAAVQALCVAEGADTDAVVRALLEDAEQRAKSRGRELLTLSLSSEDASVARAARALGYDLNQDGGEVFMLAITNLGKFLQETEAELTRRLALSWFAPWEGVIRLSSGEMKAGLRLRKKSVKAVTVRESADVDVTIHPEVLPLLLFGRMTAPEAFLQDRLSVAAADRMQALTLLDALFPRMPLYLPREQWW